MAAVTSAVIGAGVAVKGAIDGKKAADKAEKQGKESLASQKALNDPQIALANLQIDLFKNKGLPLISQFIQDSVTSAVNPEEAASNAGIDVSKSFQKAEQANEISLSRSGVSSNDPRLQSSRNSFNIARAATEAGLRNSARTQARKQRINALGNAVNSATGFGSEATGSLARISNQSQRREENTFDRQTQAEDAQLGAIGTGIDALTTLGKELDLKNNKGLTT